jgi:hypothetical protein
MTRVDAVDALKITCTDAVDVLPENSKIMLQKTPDVRGPGYQ